MSIYQERKQEIEETEFEVSSPVLGDLEFTGFQEDRSEGEMIFDSSVSIKTKLESKGFRVPVLQIERTSLPLNRGDDGTFQLPITKHDIYDDIEYAELNRILQRLDPTNKIEGEVIRFRLDYRSIWKGLTGKAM